MKNIYFLSMNNGQSEGGATVRMKGILNALAERNFNVFFFSNVNDYHNYHPEINHIKLPVQSTALDKKIFQSSVANFGYKFTNIIFSDWLKKFKLQFKDFEIDNLISFEYLDNTITYWLWKNKLIQSYSNDIHGVADLEFIKGYNISPIYLKPWFYLKLRTAKKLDMKVISNARFNIFTSSAMAEHFSKFIKSINKENFIVIPNLINSDNYQKCSDINQIIDLAPQLKNLNKNKTILFFVGSFKKTSGVLQLIKIAKNLESQVELIMVGDGHLYVNSEDLISSENIKNVYLLGRLPYEHLNCFHKLADIMICPDEDNPFSQMIVHLKYLDALMSNKPVINANFKSVQELNKNEKLSVSYPASNYTVLEDKLKDIIDNYSMYFEKYKNNRKIVTSNLSYDSYINNLTKKF